MEGAKWKSTELEISINWWQLELHRTEFQFYRINSGYGVVRTLSAPLLSKKGFPVFSCYSPGEAKVRNPTSSLVQFYNRLQELGILKKDIKVI